MSTKEGYIKKKIPNTIYILGRKVKIKQGRGLVYDNQQCLGLCDYSNNIIYLEKDQSDQSKIDTLSHECIHYFMILLGIDQKLRDSEVEIYCQSFTALFNDLKKFM